MDTDTKSKNTTAHTTWGDDRYWCGHIYILTRWFERGRQRGERRTSLLQTSKLIMLLRKQRCMGERYNKRGYSTRRNSKTLKLIESWIFMKRTLHLIKDNGTGRGLNELFQKKENKKESRHIPIDKTDKPIFPSHISFWPDTLRTHSHKIQIFLQQHQKKKTVRRLPVPSMYCMLVGVVLVNNDIGIFDKEYFSSSSAQWGFPINRYIVNQ